MKPTKEQVEAYKSMAKQSPMSMESMIKAHLVANCPKFIESKLDGCLKYLTACAREILDSKSGEVADDVCYKICRDYFNDEVWKQEEEEARKKAAKDNLVFIVGKNGKPVATAEILPGGKIGQFYGNELHHDSSKMKPGPDAVKLLDKWLEKFRESNIKFKPKKEVA